MKTLYTILLILSFSTQLQAQELVVDSTRFIGGDSSCGYSAPFYSLTTNDKGILFVGQTTCFSGGGNIPPNFPDSAWSGGGNVLIGKVDSNLNIEWIKVYGGSGDDYAVSAVETSDGGYAILCYTLSDDHDVTGNHGFRTGDLWLIKLDASGNLLWQKCYGSPYDEQPASIALAPDNGFILLGNSNGEGDDVPLHYSGSEFDYDWFVVKTDSIGNKQWTKTIGGTGDEYSEGTMLANDNGYYLISSSTSTDDDCTDTAWHAGTPCSGYHYYVFKLDTAGNIKWDSSYGGCGGEQALGAIWDSRDSSIVINGSTISDDFMVTGNYGECDLWLIKITENGVLKWGKCLGGPLYNIGTSVCNTPFGYLAAGYIDASGHSADLIYALDTAGDSLYSIQFGGPLFEASASVSQYKQGWAVTGTSAAPGFSEGVNMGYLPNSLDDVFISYLNLWPLDVDPFPSLVSAITVYPDPAKALINIELPDESGMLEIINLTGQIVFANVAQSKRIQLDISGWVPSLYIVKWQSANGDVLITKFMKN